MSVYQTGDGIILSQTKDILKVKSTLGLVPLIDYEAMFTFTADTVGNKPAGFTDWNSSNYVIAKQVGNHHHVIDMTPPPVDWGGYKYYFDSPKITGTVEFWARVTDVDGRENGYMINDVDTEQCCTIVCRNGYWAYYKALHTVSNIVAATPNKWEHFRMDWDATTRKAAFWMNGILLASNINFRQSGAGTPTEFHVNTSLDGQSWHLYLDALDFSWASGYVADRSRTVAT